MSRYGFCIVSVGLILLSGCGDKPTEPASPSAPISTNETKSGTAPKPELGKLVGKWARTDGDYLLEITSVDSSGKVEAGYYNPNPIHISRAAGYVEDGKGKVVVELRDEGYPGCIYTLTHSPDTDQLFGTYFQAAMQETYEVVFSRVK